MGEPSHLSEIVVKDEEKADSLTSLKSLSSDNKQSTVQTLKSTDKDRKPALAHGFLYRTRCYAEYQAVEHDEISLQVGDIIQVVKFDDPEDVEEEWMMGVNERTGDRGLFPINFTRRFPQTQS